MTAVGLSVEQNEIISTLLASFLMSERERFYRIAEPIPDQERGPLSKFFRSEVLEYTRVHQVAGESLRNPDFYPVLKTMGLANLPEFATIEAITYADVIVFAKPINSGLLFHELVHAEQYRQLGVTGFARRYARGFLEAGAYEAIPLEIQAYGLGAQFESDPRRPFSVEEEVSRWILEGRL